MNNILKSSSRMLLIIALATLPHLLFSQANSSFNSADITYKEYMEKVVNNNLGYTSEKFNVNIADAKIKAAAIFQDPSLAIDWSRDQENNSFSAYSLSAAFSKTFELSGKRKARINLAKSERQLTNALLNDFLRNLQVDATLDYLSALKQEYLFKVTLNSFQMMKKLSDADSVRLALGSIKAIDASQSKIEAGILFNDLLQVEADRKSSFLNLSTQTSSFHSDTLLIPKGKFNKPERTYVLSDLLITALNNRADLLAAKSYVTFSEKQLDLTVRERKTDIDFNIGAANSYANPGITSPASTTIFSGISVPLKFSNLNKSEILVAKYQVEQAELLYKQVEIIIQNEVIQAYNQYLSLIRQVDNYDQGLLEQAKIVLNGKIYSYSRGETSLLEVLNAQRTYNDLQIAYYETMYNCYSALVELERAVGIWDIDI